MATFQKRNGRITATVRIKPHKPKSKTFDTLRDAKKWAQETEVELKNEKQLIFDHVILKDAMEEYRDTISIKKRGADREISRINYILKHMRCDIPLINVDKEFLVNWREWQVQHAEILFCWLAFLPGVLRPSYGLGEIRYVMYKCQKIQITVNVSSLKMKLISCVSTFHQTLKIFFYWLLKQECGRLKSVG